MVDMELGKGFDRKVFMYFIADDLFNQIGRGQIKIKGVR